MGGGGGPRYLGCRVGAVWGGAGCDPNQNMIQIHTNSIEFHPDLSQILGFSIFLKNGPFVI